MLILALITHGFGSLSAHSSESPFEEQRSHSTVSVRLKQSAPIANTGSLPLEGIYLYGQSSQPEQLGQTYLVFEARDNKIIGAFYKPSSSFDCFYGMAKPEQLSMTVVDSYSQAVYPYSVAREQNMTIASANSRSTAATLALRDFHPIHPPSANDQNILDICKANYQDRVW
ncbi:MAG: hypothetical protein F6K19_03150 [Cyanothece sp. SIO1E1]|nr:hypothetical protein [Cyanothece sp. SIO1E1]